MAASRKTAEFDTWLKGLRDQRAKAKVLVRIQRLEAGNPGDVGPVGDNISEMRIHYGPGYRVYFKLDAGNPTPTILFGGDKSTQQADIDKAKAIAKELKE